MIEIRIDDGQVLSALQRLAAAGTDLTPALKQVGEYLVDATRQRFASSTAPDGTPWAPNTEATYLQYLGLFKGSYTKTGRLSKAGAGRAAGKRPLIGETKSLSTLISYRVDGTTLEVGSPLVYAATHQFGARKGEFGTTRRGAPIPWGDIPARPFLGLSDDDKTEVLAILQEHLARAVGTGA